LVSSKIFFPLRFHRFRIKTQMIKANISIGRWVDKFLARLLATAVLWVRTQTYLKNTKWAT
jgi:hypothetical protein